MAREIDYTSKPVRKATIQRAGIAVCPACGRNGATKKIAGVRYYCHKAVRSSASGDMRARPVDECAVKEEE